MGDDETRVPTEVNDFMRVDDIRPIDLDRCPICNGNLGRALFPLEERVDARTKISVDVDGLRCEDCGEDFYHDDALRAVQTLAKQVRAQMEEILSVNELAAYLRTHENTIYAMIKEDRLPAFKVGREWRFHKRAVDALLAQTPHNEAAVAAYE